MPRKLKVFRTPIGFHDAYVAVPTKKAALAAWGSAANLFARGVAEEVIDPELTKAPLAAPGTVVKLSRGTAAEHVAALGKVEPPKRRASGHPTPKPAAGRSRPRRDLNDAGHRSPDAPKGEGRKKVSTQPKPKPSRTKLDSAEAALGRAEKTQAAASDELARRERALAAGRRALEKAQAAERTKLEKARGAAGRAYAAALAKWRG